MTGRWKFLPLVIVGFLVVIQFNRPATTNRPVYPNEEIAAVLNVNQTVQSIFQRSCNDCHSNRTVWPWYSHVAPISWLVVSDVDDGRRRMNFSEWSTYTNQKSSDLLRRICKKVQDGDMPPLQYIPMHLASRLTQEDRRQICLWTADTTVTRPAPVTSR